MWLYCPGTMFPSSPGSEESPLALDLLEGFAVACTLRGSSHALRSWKNAWKKNAWMRHRFGMMPAQSIMARGVAEWMESLQAGLALQPLSRGNDLAMPMNDGSGRKLSGQSENRELLGSSVRTCRASYRWMGTHWVEPGEPTLFGVEDLVPSSLIWPKWASMRNGYVFPQPPVALRTSESGSSCLRGGEALAKPTPLVCDHQPQTRGPDNQRSVQLSTMVEKMWPTITTSDQNTGSYNPEQRTGPRMGGQRPLADAAMTWQTPTSTEAKGRDYTYSAGDHEVPFLTLTGQAQSDLWSTPMAHDGRRPGEDIFSTQGNNLSRESSLWRTPATSDVGTPVDQLTAKDGNTPQIGHRMYRHGKDGERINQTQSLELQANVWATPTAQNASNDASESQAGSFSPPVTSQVVDFLCSLQAPVTVSHGAQSSPSGRSSPLPYEEIRQILQRLPGWCKMSLTGKKTKKGETSSRLIPDQSTICELRRLWLLLQDRYWRPRLNPKFVCWLQGLPQGMTSVEPMSSGTWETWLNLSRSQLRLLCS